MGSSEELEWELFEIFENGLFAFPVYDHKSARSIVRYLLRRGVLEEEIGDAIEESSADLLLWLDRGGKQMVGEWVISWINETRDEYEQEVEMERIQMEQSRCESTFGHSIATSESGDTDSGDTCTKHGDRCKIENSNKEECIEEPTVKGGSAVSVISNEKDVTDIISDEENGLTRLPRSLRRKWSKNGKISPATFHPDSEDTSSVSSTVFSEVFTGHYSPQNSDKDDSGCRDDGVTGSSFSSPSLTPSSVYLSDTDYNQNRKCNYCKLAQSNVFRIDRNGLPVKSQCACTLAHYSYVKVLSQASYLEDKISMDSADEKKNDPVLEINVDTMDRDGPGFIFIMTDSLRECMPWSAESRYKVASSRKPERCLLEFRSHNVDIDLIWQVRVDHHVVAVKEVHKSLQKYNLHSNWYRCSLSEIMEAISKVIKHYKQK